MTVFVTKCSGEWWLRVFAHVKEEITQRLYVMVTECIGEWWLRVFARVTKERLESS